MPYNNNSANGNNRAQFDVNTTSLILYSGNMSLRMDLYNRNLQIGLIRAVQNSEGKNTFPKDSAVKVLLTPERVQSLVTMITDGLISALEARRPYSSGLITNSRMTNMILVGCDTDGNTYLDIYTGMDERRLPKESARFIFNRNQTLSKFNPNTGDYEQGPDIQGQLYLFTRCLEDFSYNTSMTGAHFNRVAENSYNRRLMALLQDIAIKIGVPVRMNNGSGSDNGSYRYGGNTQNGNNGGFTNSSVMNTPIPESNVTSLDDIDGGDLPF